MEWKFIWDTPTRSDDEAMHVMFPNHLDLGVTYFWDCTDYDVLETAYMFLIERFDKFLHKKGEKGMLRLDRTSAKLNSLNPKDRRILDFINRIRKHGTGWQPIEHIVEEPLFLVSSESAGLQIADAVAYCTASHVKKNCDFDSYWNLIYEKAQKSPSKNINGYGLYCFPK